MIFQPKYIFPRVYVFYVEKICKSDFVMEWSAIWDNIAIQFILLLINVLGYDKYMKGYDQYTNGYDKYIKGYYKYITGYDQCINAYEKYTKDFLEKIFTAMPKKYLRLLCPLYQ